jgi:hypothetical protein
VEVEMKESVGWRVDAIEEGMAAIEDRAGRRFDIPLEVLPADVREGQVLAVEIARGAAEGEVRLRIVLDREATERAFARSVEQLRGIPEQNDPGGDIHL